MTKKVQPFHILSALPFIPIDLMSRTCLLRNNKMKQLYGDF